MSFMHKWWKFGTKYKYMCSVDEPFNHTHKNGIFDHERTNERAPPMNEGTRRWHTDKLLFDIVYILNFIVTCTNFDTHILYKPLSRYLLHLRDSKNQTKILQDTMDMTIQKHTFTHLSKLCFGERKFWLLCLNIWLIKNLNYCCNICIAPFKEKYPQW
jgi:hypothetical protein